MSKTIIALTLMGLMAVAYAGDRPSMSDGSKRECEHSFNCNDKCDDTVGARGCFFRCLKKRFERSPRLDGGVFLDEVDEVYSWCKENKKDDAHETKLLKCTLKRIKKDACRWYFREQRKNSD